MAYIRYSVFSVEHIKTGFSQILKATFSPDDLDIWAESIANVCNHDLDVYQEWELYFLRDGSKKRTMLLMRFCSMRGLSLDLKTIYWMLGNSTKSYNGIFCLMFETVRDGALKNKLFAAHAVQSRPRPRTKKGQERWEYCYQQFKAWTRDHDLYRSVTHYDDSMVKDTGIDKKDAVKHRAEFEKVFSLRFEWFARFKG